MNNFSQFIVQPEAIAEARTAYDWYEARNPAAARRFQAAVEQAIEAIFRMPLSWPPYDEETRYYSLRRFLYRIVYLISDDTRTHRCRRTLSPAAGLLAGSALIWRESRDHRRHWYRRWSA